MTRYGCQADYEAIAGDKSANLYLAKVQFQLSSRSKAHLAIKPPEPMKRIATLGMIEVLRLRWPSICKAARVNQGLPFSAGRFRVVMHLFIGLSNAKI
jgi:hypothetical protein